MLRQLVSVIGFGLAITGCATPEQPSSSSSNRVPMTQDALQAMFAEGGTLTNTNTQGVQSTITMTKDGLLSATWTDGGDNGHYRIADGKICATWENAYDGAERCMSLYQVSNNRYQLFNPDGTMNSEFSMQ